MADSIQTLKLQSDPTTNVYPNILTDNIPSSAVTSAKLASSAVTASKIATGAVTTTKILDANITSEKVADDAITTAKILDANVTTPKIADDAITTDKIADANVTIDKLNVTRQTLYQLNGNSSSITLTALSTLIQARNVSSAHIRFRVSSSSIVGDVIFSTNPVSREVYYVMDVNGWQTVANDTQASSFMGTYGSYIYDVYLG